MRSEERREQVQQLVGDAPVFVCDVEFEDQIERLAGELAEQYDVLHGLVHSIAFADYEDGDEAVPRNGRSATSCGRSTFPASRWWQCPTR